MNTSITDLCLVYSILMTISMMDLWGGKGTLFRLVLVFGFSIALHLSSSKGHIEGGDDVDDVDDRWALSPGPQSPHTTCLGYSGPILSPGPQSPHTTCLGYSGPILSPGPQSPHTTCLGYSGPILSPGLSHLIRHVWDTVDLFYPRALSHLIRHVWDTVDLFYPRALATSYDMSGIQWTYSIPGP